MYGFIFKLFLLYMDIETNIDKTNQHCFDGVKSLLKTFPRIFFKFMRPGPYFLKFHMMISLPLFCYKNNLNVFKIKSKISLTNFEPLTSLNIRTFAPTKYCQDLEQSKGFDCNQTVSQIC